MAIAYAQLGKKVILISATPQNNYNTDIANQLYLFQSKNNSIHSPNFSILKRRKKVKKKDSCESFGISGVQ